MDETHPAVTAQWVKLLATHAALPLGEGREAAIAPVLGAWLRDANALSAKMSAHDLRDVVPAIVFTHPDAPDREA
jgi:hypothetical protein